MTLRGAFRLRAKLNVSYEGADLTDQRNTF